ncbi:MAG: flagellar basal body L-ring protein FlgH [Rickettsiales bacterium]|nr:flagellar basal body L-ring protein FlgH [Rickettsiales bacterium]
MSHTRNIVMTSLIAVTSLSGCTNTLKRLETVGQTPPLKEVEALPVQKVSYSPDALQALRQHEPIAPRTPNSLWQAGSKTFFRDQRARKVGDILTVVISVKDKAELDNKTERKRKSSDSAKAPAIFGLQNKIVGLLPEKANPANLLSLSGDNSSTGEGVVEREEKIETEIAAMITNVLPNGNFVIQGSQEVLVNYEVREIGVQGIVRPEDISSNNLVTLNQIAEARVTYGGRGHIMEAQQPRLGNQLVDILSPF